jgi:hypothetical protein
MTSSMTGEKETRFGKRGVAFRAADGGETKDSCGVETVEGGGLGGGVEGNDMPSALSSC